MNNYIIRKKVIYAVQIDGECKNVYYTKDFKPMDGNKFPKDFEDVEYLIYLIKKACNCKNVVLFNIINFEDEYIEAKNVVELQETLEIKPNM